MKLQGRELLDYLKAKYGLLLLVDRIYDMDVTSFVMVSRSDLNSSVKLRSGL